MSIREIKARVVRCKSCTVIANAFRKALGLPMAYLHPKKPAMISVDLYEDMRGCFANNSSPLDGRCG